MNGNIAENPRNYPSDRDECGIWMLLIKIKIKKLLQLLLPLPLLCLSPNLIVSKLHPTLPLIYVLSEP